MGVIDNSQRMVADSSLPNMTTKGVMSNNLRNEVAEPSKGGGSDHITQDITPNEDPILER